MDLRKFADQISAMARNLHTAKNAKIFVVDHEGTGFSIDSICWEASPEDLDYNVFISIKPEHMSECPSPNMARAIAERDAREMDLPLEVAYPIEGELERVQQARHQTENDEPIYTEADALEHQQAIKEMNQLIRDGNADF